MKDIIIAFPQYKGEAHDSMSIYYSTVREELVSLGWNVLGAIPQNYEEILKNYPGKYSFFSRLVFCLVRTTRSWMLEYWVFLFFISLNRAGAPLLAISQEYAPVFYKNRSIVVVHDMIQQNYPRSTLVGMLYKHIIPWSLRKCAAAVSVSKTTQSILLDCGVASSVVYNYIDIGEQEKNHHQLKVKKFPSSVLWVGTAARHKSLETLLLAAAQIPELTFNVILPGRDVSLISSPSSNVNLRSDLSSNALRDLYLSSDIFISTSLDEGYGRPAMEARVLGCRLILSDLPIYKELHGGAASFFEPGDSNELIAALKVSMKDNVNVVNADLSSLTATKDELAKEVSNLAIKIL